MKKNLYSDEVINFILQQVTNIKPALLTGIFHSDEQDYYYLAVSQRGGYGIGKGNNSLVNFHREVSSDFKQENLLSESLLIILNAKGNFTDIIQKVKNITDNTTYQEGLSELATIEKRLQAMRMRDDTYCYNLAIVRGHNYYTGTVFEVYIKNKRNLGAIGGGGRYDNLCGNFIDKQVQGVGMSIGITRLFDILKSENMVNLQTSSVKVGIITFDEESLSYGLNLMIQLRENNIKADILSEEKSFKAKMKEANRKQIPYVIICGEDEVNSNTYALKNMETSEQVSLTLSKLINTLTKK